MIVPFDLAAVEATPNWRADFAWPVCHAEVKKIIRDITVRYVDGIEEIADPDSRRLAKLATRTLSEILLVAETAVLIAAARADGLRFVGGPPLVSALQGNDRSEARYTPRAELVYRPIRHQFLRRVARTVSWSSWQKLPRALFRPDALALSHNTLLHSEARHSGRGIGFTHAEGLISEARNRAPAGPLPDIEPVIALAHRVLAATAEIPSDLMELSQRLVSERLIAYLTGLASDMAAVRSLDMPEEIWCGSAGHRPVRTLAVEAQRRGNRVVVHDHAGAAGLFVDAISLRITELAVADRFVANTEAAATLVRTSGSLDHLPSEHGVEVVGGGGDPYFRTRSRRGHTSGAERKRVLYVVGSFEGQARRSPPSLNDPLKLDWWMRMSQHLMALPIDLKVQAHPGGVTRGKPNPLRSVAPLSNRRFEEMLEWPDLLVVDITQSTTFTVALCTDLPIVLIDYGRNEFTPALKPMIDARCRTVVCSFDDRNRVVIDRDALAAAVLDAPKDADPGPFRRLFAGQYA